MSVPSTAVTRIARANRSVWPRLSKKRNPLPKHLLRDQEPLRRPSDADVRASAGRIVDILQQIVLARPEMIIPLEEIVSGIVENLRTHVVTQIWEGQEGVRSHARRPLPPVPLSQLPAMLALLEPEAGQRTSRKRTARAVSR
jgi:hypothetical protein